MNRQTNRLLREYWHEMGVPVGKEFPTREEVVAHCLVRWAENMYLLPCPNVADCEVCNIDFTIWWDWHNTLSPLTRIAVQKILAWCHVPLPPGPWEEVPTNAVSDSL
jgi:hypothetical protein